MSDVIVRATYEFDGWAVVAVVPTADGRAARALVTRVDAELQIPAGDLWVAIAATVERSGITLPPAPDVTPMSPGAGVREWHLPAPRSAPQPTTDDLGTLR